MAVGSDTHGLNGYFRGCRCDQCRAELSAYQRGLAAGTRGDLDVARNSHFMAYVECAACRTFNVPTKPAGSACEKCGVKP